MNCIGIYRAQLKLALPALIEKWEKKLNVNVLG